LNASGVPKVQGTSAIYLKDHTSPSVRETLDSERQASLYDGRWFIGMGHGQEQSASWLEQTPYARQERRRIRQGNMLEDLHQHA
jgi:hypothetical protein